MLPFSRPNEQHLRIFEMNSLWDLWDYWLLNTVRTFGYFRCWSPARAQCLLLLTEIWFLRFTCYASWFWLQVFVFIKKRFSWGSCGGIFILFPIWHGFGPVLLDLLGTDCLGSGCFGGWHLPGLFLQCPVFAGTSSDSKCQPPMATCSGKSLESLWPDTRSMDQSLVGLDFPWSQGPVSQHFCWWTGDWSGQEPVPDDQQGPFRLEFNRTTDLALQSTWQVQQWDHAGRRFGLGDNHPWQCFRSESTERPGSLGDKHGTWCGWRLWISCSSRWDFCGRRKCVTRDQWRKQESSCPWCEARHQVVGVQSRQVTCWSQSIYYFHLYSFVCICYSSFLCLLMPFVLKLCSFFHWSPIFDWILWQAQRNPTKIL